MKKYKLSLDESTPNSFQMNTLITVEADTLVGLLSKFLLAMTAHEERMIETIQSESVNDDDIPF